MRWDVDDRPPSPYTRLYEMGMWLGRDKRAFEGPRHTLAEARRRQRSGDRAPTLLTRLRVNVSSGSAGEMTVWTTRPRRDEPLVRVVYVHGGGYVHPLTTDYWRLIRGLTKAPAEVVVPAYPLSPDATVDDVLPDLLELINAVTASTPALPTVLMGDSAGGAIVLALATRLRDNDGEMPVGVVTLSPWLDATLDEEEVADLESSDPMLAESGLRAAGRWWSGVRSPKDPIVSPVSADLRHLPPVDVYVGRHDILRPAVSNFAAQAEDAGLDLHIHEATAMFHVWMTRLIPEGRRTRRELTALIRTRAQSPPASGGPLIRHG